MQDNLDIEGIIHDLKTPITSIIGFVELLKKGGHDEKTVREFYDIIDSEAKRLLKLIDSMPRISLKANSAGTSGICNLSVEIQKFVKELEPLADKRNIKIDIKVNSEEIYVSVPESKIARIVTNIVENAIKYNKESGKIFINLVEKSNLAYIKIKDTGIGIAENEIDKVFDRHYRATSGKEINVEGSGLGLAIAKDIAESYGGSIKVSSKLGESTEFIISFPISRIS